MSRARAQVFRGVQDHRQARRDRAFHERQQLKISERNLDEPLPKVTLAEKILPWKRRKAKQRAEHREQARANVKQYAQFQQSRQKGIAMHRHAWRGIHTQAERRRLQAINILRDGEIPTYDHPQQRKVERRMRERGRAIAGQ